MIERSIELLFTKLCLSSLRAEDGMAETVEAEGEEMEMEAPSWGTSDLEPASERRCG